MKTYFSFIILLIHLSLHAQNCGTPNSIEYLDINNFKATLQNGGGLWLNEDTSGGYGMQSNNELIYTQIFSGGLFLSGINPTNNKLHFAGANYQIENGDFWSGPILSANERISSTECQLWNRHFKINQATIDNYKLNQFPVDVLSVPFEIKEWPAKGNAYLQNLGMTLTNDYAPFFDSNNNQIYDPQNGDYPLIKGDQAIYWVYNDFEGPFHADFGGNKIGAEIQVMAYAFTNSYLLNATFYDYKVINRSNISYNNFYFSHYIDVDNLTGIDDRIGVDTLNHYAFTYNDIDSSFDVYNFLISNALICVPTNDFDKVKYSIVKNLSNFQNSDTLFRSFQIQEPPAQIYSYNPAFFYAGNPSNFLEVSECSEGIIGGDRAIFLSYGPFDFPINNEFNFTLMNHSDLHYIDYSCLDRDSFITPNFLLAKNTVNSLESCGFKETTTSIKNKNIDNIEIKQDSNNGAIVISNNSNEIFKLNLYNSLGKQLYSDYLIQGQNIINKQDFGVYFIQISDLINANSINKTIIFH